MVVREGVGAINQAVFRVDAATEIGGGHVMRCLALADALGAAGWRCAFARRRDRTLPVPALDAVAVEVIDLDDDGETAALGRHWPDGVDLLVVDHYGLDARFESACRTWARRILVIDDLADRRHDADILLDQTLGRHADAYEGLVPSDCRLLLGTGYAMLRSEFAAARDVASAKRRGGNGVRRILVAAGSSDPTGVTSLALDAIGRSGLAAGVDVAIGSGAPHLDRIRRAAARLCPEARVHVDLDARGMAEVMGRADLAIGASGSTAWERCCLGLPSIVVACADNQRLIAAALGEAGAALSLGRAVDVDAGKIAAALCGLAADVERLLGMSAKALAICDGRGAHRVVEALAA